MWEHRCFLVDRHVFLEQEKLLIIDLMVCVRIRGNALKIVNRTIHLANRKIPVTQAFSWKSAIVTKHYNLSNFCLCVTIRHKKCVVQATKNKAVNSVRR